MHGKTRPYSRLLQRLVDIPLESIPRHLLFNINIGDLTLFECQADIINYADFILGNITRKGALVILMWYIKDYLWRVEEFHVKKFLSSC